MVLPELASIRLAAHEDSGRLLGHRVLPVVGLCPGYRHVHLRTELGLPLPASLFVLVVVKVELLHHVHFYSYWGSISATGTYICVRSSAYLLLGDRFYNLKVGYSAPKSSNLSPAINFLINTNIFRVIKYKNWQKKKQHVCLDNKHDVNICSSDRLLFLNSSI